MLRQKKKIAIVTWYNHKNFGGSLQAFALQEVLKKNDYEVKFLNVCNNKNVYAQKIKNLIRLVLKRNKFDIFEFKYLDLSKAYKQDRIDHSNKDFDIFICGSDQIWAPNVFNSFYFLDFVEDNKKKGAYAASIGLNYIPEELHVKYKYLIGRLDFVSVREKKGCELVKKLFDIDASLVLDPTFLLSSCDWNTFLPKKINTKEKYLFCYFLNKNNNYKNKVICFAKRYNLKIKCISKNIRDKEYSDEFISDVGPIEFLQLIKEAFFVFTDSFHGMALSLNLNKNFYIFKRFVNDDLICQNSRIYNLIDLFSIPEVLIDDDEDNIDFIKINKIDFDSINTQLNILREGSIDFLLTNLKKESKND